MRKISIALVTGAGVLLANSAMAADVFTNDATYLGMNQPNVEQVRLVCDDSGRCYRGSRRVVIQQGYGDSYNYAPRERYIERRGTMTSRAPASASARRASALVWASVTVAGST